MASPLVLVFTDVVGSTRLNDELGDAVMGPLWAEHDRVARESVRRWQGKEVGRTDGFLLVFGEVGDAVGFALDYHRALRKLPVPLEARVGIHVGPATLRNNTPDDIAQGATPFEIDGVALPTAARVMEAANGGQTLLSSAAVTSLGVARLHLVSHGHWRMKGLAEPIELFEVGDVHCAFRPPADSTKAYRVVLVLGQWQPVRELPGSLPGERDAFVGRADALHALAAHFEHGARLVTLTGMGGIGKTRLALRYARSWLGNFPGGAWFCDLSSARDVDGIVHAVSSGLNVPLGRADPVQQLGAAIAGRGACLVILDNFEQVVGHAEATLGRWLERAPQAVFIATSREVLSIAGEQLLTLPPMHGDEADALFRARVQAHGLSSDFDGPDEQAVSPLMELLDGLPLAIELAAARTQLIPPRELLQRMSSRFDLLAARGGRRDRQATLRAALDWSWELLSPAEQSALAQMSVFEGGFTLQAAEAVLDLSAHPHAAALVNLVQALVEKSLLRQALPSRRLNLSRTVHDYALQQLAVYCAAASDDKAGALSEARHGRYYAGLHATRSDAELTTEMENLVVATHRAVAAQNRDTALGALQGAWGALKLRGPFRAVIDLADKVRSIAGIDAACRGRIDWIAGWALKSGGRSDEARACFEAALQTARAANDRAWEGDVLSLLGDLHVNAGRFDEGRRALTAALDIALSAGHGVLACRVHTGLGILHWRLGDLDQARAQHEAALTAARRAGDRHWEGGSLGNLGAMHASIGHMAEAESLYLQALAIARELGDRTFEGNTLCNLGLLHHVRGEYARAAVALETALVAARELGHAQLEGVVLCNLGMTMEAMHEAAAALGHYQAALRIAREMRDTRTQGQVLGYLGTLLGRQGRFVEGLACLREGAQLLEATPDKLSLALLLSGRAECEHLAGNADAAREAWQSAQTLAAHLGTAAGAELNQALARVSALIRPA